MRLERTWIAGGALATVVACANDAGDSAGAGTDTIGPGDGVYDTGSWWEVDTDWTTSAGGEGDGDDEEGEEDGEEEEDFLAWVGEGMVVPGESMELEVEFIDFRQGEDRCTIFATSTSAMPDESCDACEFAFEVTLGNTEAAATETCAEHGLDPPTLDGRVLGLGYAAGTLYWKEQGTWSAVAGEAEYAPAEQLIFWEYLLAVD